MRRTIIPIAAAVLCLGIAMPSAAAAPAAQVSPSYVRAGGVATVYVSCDTSWGWGLRANSQAFDRGGAFLRKVPNNHPAGGSAYVGWARVAPPGNFNTFFSTWGVDGNCPDGEQFTSSFTVVRGR